MSVGSCECVCVILGGCIWVHEVSFDLKLRVEGGVVCDLPLPSILDQKVPRALEYTHPTPPKHTLTSSHDLPLTQYILTQVFT